jgi:hypothetical protein
VDVSLSHCLPRISSSLRFSSELQWVRSVFVFEVQTVGVFQRRGRKFVDNLPETAISSSK